MSNGKDEDKDELNPHGLDDGDITGILEKDKYDVSLDDEKDWDDSMEVDEKKSLYDGYFPTPLEREGRRIIFEIGEKEMKLSEKETTHKCTNCFETWKTTYIIHENLFCTHCGVSQKLFDEDDEKYEVKVDFDEMVEGSDDLDF